MPRDFPRVSWASEVVDAAKHLLQLARAEDLSDGIDWTTAVTVDPQRRGEATVVARHQGVLAGIEIGALVLEAFKADAQFHPLAKDGDQLSVGQPVAQLLGRAADLLTAERTILNFLGRLSGIATATSRYVGAIEGTAAEVFDTRKTTPGWRLLEKYAVACGGGRNHRLGLSEAVLIKDNHLALSDQVGLSPAESVQRAQERLQDRLPERADRMVVEVEVDTLDQLGMVLSAAPDIVLLDNMSPQELAEAVAMRDSFQQASPGTPAPVLEASGGVNLDTIGAIARSGVDRISIGALTHSAACFDFGLDWGPSDG